MKNKTTEDERKVLIVRNGVENYKTLIEKNNTLIQTIC